MTIWNEDEREAKRIIRLVLNQMINFVGYGLDTTVG